MNDLGKGNWFLMLVLLVVVGMAVFVMATAPTWGSSSTINYTTVEEVTYSHNLSNNITGYNNDVNFSIDSGDSISWTNASGTFLVSASSVSDWISITDILTGNLTINAKYDNQTGFFVVPIQATNTTDGGEFTGTNFEFIINATNDAPNFTSDGIADSYTFTPGDTNNFNLTGADEESHYPLFYNITFNDTCTHGDATPYTDDDYCNLTAFGLSLNYLSNTTSNISFTPTADHVGTYWANISVRDAANISNCPHDYCDATYNTTNLTTYYSQMVLFTVSPTMTVDISNCSGAILMEDEAFNCTVVVTTPGEGDSLTITSDASFREGTTSSGYNTGWFNPLNSSPDASNFNYNITFPVTPTKINVGNLSINLTVTDDTEGVTVSETIYIYVNYTEFEVTLDSVSDLNGSNALYEDYTFYVNATDEDLLILDGDVKEEDLTFYSNTSWLSYDSKATSSDTNYSTATFIVDHSAALLLNISGGNYTVKINVTDVIGNSANRTFVIEIRNETAPEWNDTLADPVVLNLIEGTLFEYNVSKNVSDVDAADTITFYYINNSGEFCSLNDTTFNRTTGIINFTPTDCDVGYHNVTIIASDSYLNASQQFNFTIANIADSPEVNSLNNGTGGISIANASTYNLSEGSTLILELVINDDDFLIPSGQRDIFYNETLTVDVVATNSTGQEESLFEFSFVEYGSSSSQSASYNASFTPTGDQVDNYTIWINVSDNSGDLVNRTFYLNISSTPDPPDITLIENQSITIHDYFNITVNAIDDEDDRDGVNLNYSIYPLSATYPNLTINNITGVIIFNFENNESYAGIWGYNVTVNDSDNQGDYQVFYVTVYGNQTLLSPSEGIIFNVTENSASLLNFTTNHSVGDNLTYEFRVDSITCAYQNASNCDYGGLSLRETLNSFGNGSATNWSFTSNYTDETYGNLKNLSIKVYPNTTNINSTQRDSVATYFNFSLNVSHTNSPPVAYESIGSSSGTYGASSPISFNLLNHFRDYDYLDTYYQQNVVFTISSSASTSGIMAESYIPGNVLTWEGLISSWSLQLYAATVLEESVTIMANDSYESVNLTAFTVTFTAPSTTTTTVPTSGGGGGTTKLKHYSLKLIVPQDVTISDQNYIDIPFMVQNNGQVDLKGINLNSFVRYNDEFSEDVRISLGDSYIEELKYGQSENFSMRIFANTQRSGRYKATILANVTTPKFSDCGEFFIDLRRTNETEAEQILIFTEKLVAENPECLELTEILNEAKEAFVLGEYSNSLRLATEATEACEDAITANEQIKFPVAGFVKDNFYYISFSTLVIFLAGFIFYVYKRVRFNKYKVDDYV